MRSPRLPSLSSGRSAQGRRALASTGGGGNTGGLGGGTYVLVEQADSARLKARLLPVNRCKVGIEGVPGLFQLVLGAFVVGGKFGGQHVITQELHVVAVDGRLQLADKAAEIEEMNRAQALAARSRIPAAPGCAECEDCGDPIPEARRRAYPSATRCTECQALHERHAKNR